MGKLSSPSRTVQRSTGSSPPLATTDEPTGPLASQLAGEMAQRWRQGERPLVEEFLARHVELGDAPTAAIKLICEEICLRQEHGEEVPSIEVLRRFPQWRDQLEVLLGCHRLLLPAVAPVFPEVGETLGDFLLLRQLGKGAQGRVFLATQPSLADRPMVVKVTPCTGEEHLSLARLQHTHIVPLYLVQDDPERNLRVLCMPYFGGTALSDILTQLKDQPPNQRSGSDLLRILDKVAAQMPVATPTAGPARKLLERASYVQAICWIGACLADALHYAHERGLVHLDLKPSNVLLAADGEPMLLDFHLAREPIHPDSPVPEWFGGTPGYMSPEQQAAIEAVSTAQPVPRSVDVRSDVYSLGLLLYEALVAALPGTRGVVPSWIRRRNPQVSSGLADLIARCLRPEPAERYAGMAELAADLRRHLTDQPLRGVANRSLIERWRKWRRRQPHALKSLAVRLIFVGMALAGAGLGWSYLRQNHREAEEALAVGQEQLQNRAYTEATRTLTRGLERARELPGRADLTAALERQLQRVRQAQRTQELHALADQVRFLYDADALPADRARALESSCRSVWEARDFLQAQGLQPLSMEKQLQTDLLDLGILWAALHVRLAPAEQSAGARQEALRTLDELEKLVGPSLVLHRERQAHAQALGLTDLARAAADQADRLAPQTAWEHYALGRSLLRAGKLAEASAQLDRAVELEPQGFWANFYQGVCAYRLGKANEAVQAFRVCIALAPGRAECYYNRALAYQALGQSDRALSDFSQALRLQPALTAASFNRGVLHHREKRYREARADLEQALAGGFDPVPVHYNLAVTLLAQKDRTAAAAHLNQVLRQSPHHKEARELLSQMQRER